MFFANKNWNELEKPYNQPPKPISQSTSSTSGNSSTSNEFDFYQSNPNLPIYPNVVHQPTVGSNIQYYQPRTSFSGQMQPQLTNAYGSPANVYIQPQFGGQLVSSVQPHGVQPHGIQPHNVQQPQAITDIYGSKVIAANTDSEIKKLQEQIAQLSYKIETRSSNSIASQKANDTSENANNRKQNTPMSAYDIAIISLLSGTSLVFISILVVLIVICSRLTKTRL